MLYTPSHRERSLARDLARGRCPDLYLGNALADVAAGVRAAEAAAPSAVVEAVNMLDAVSILILKRLVVLGIGIADKPRVVVVRPRVPRPDVVALVAASQHHLRKSASGFACDCCGLTLTPWLLRASHIVRGGGHMVRVIGSDWRWSTL